MQKQTHTNTNSKRAKRATQFLQVQKYPEVYLNTFKILPLPSVIEIPSWPCWLFTHGKKATMLMISLIQDCAKVLSPFQHTNLIQWRNFHLLDDHKNESSVVPVRYIDLPLVGRFYTCQVLQDWSVTSMEPRHRKGLRWGPISSPSRMPGYAVCSF